MDGRGPVEAAPRPASLAVVLGSGLSDVCASFATEDVLPFADVPGVGAAGIVGHRGELARCRVGPHACWFVRGRRHYYEGEPGAIEALVDTIAARASCLLMTSAAGSVDTRFQPGELVLVDDVVDLQARPALARPCRERYRPCHHAASERGHPPGRPRLDAGLMMRIAEAAQVGGVALARGVAAVNAGPVYETPAEVNFLQRVGASVVSMSGAPEIEAAVAHGLPVAWIVLVTNLATGMQDNELRHSDVVDQGRRSVEAFTRLIAPLLDGLDRDER